MVSIQSLEYSMKKIQVSQISQKEAIHDAFSGSSDSARKQTRFCLHLRLHTSVLLSNKGEANV